MDPKQFHIIQEEEMENPFMYSNPDPGKRRAQLLKSRSKLRGGFKFYDFHFKPLSTIEELPEPESSSVVAIRTNQYESNDGKRLGPDAVRTSEKHAFKSPAKANERDAPTVRSSSHIYASSNPDMTNMVDNVTVQVSTSEIDASKSRNGLKETKENILATKAPISSRIPRRSGERKCKIDCNLMAKAPPCSDSTQMKSPTNAEDNAKSAKGAFPVPRSFSGRKNNADMRGKLLMNSADCSHEIMDKKTKRIPENISEMTISETKNKKYGEMVETSEKIFSPVSYKPWRKKKTAEMNKRSEENLFQFSDELSPTSETGKAKKLIKENNDLSKNRFAMNVKKPRVEDVRGINEKADRKNVPSHISIKTTNISAKRPSEICDMVRPLINKKKNLASRISTMHLKQGPEVIEKRDFVDLSDKDLIALKIKGCLNSNPDMTNIVDNVTVQVSTSEVDASKSRNGLKVMKENVSATKAPISSRIPRRSGERKCKIDCSLIANAPPCSNSTQMKSPTNVEDNAKSVKGAFPVPRSFSGSFLDLSDKDLITSKIKGFLNSKHADKPPETPLKNKCLPKPSATLPKRKSSVKYYETSQKVKSFIKNPEIIPKDKLPVKHPEIHLQTKSSAKSSAMTTERKLIPKKHEDSSKVKSLIKSPKIMSRGDTRGIRNEADFESNPSINVYSSSSINKTKTSARKTNEVNQIVRSPIIKKKNSSTIPKVHSKLESKIIKNGDFLDPIEKDIIVLKAEEFQKSKQDATASVISLKENFPQKASKTVCIPKSKIPVKYYETSPKVKSFIKNPEIIPNSKLPVTHPEMPSQTKSSAKSSAMTTERKLIPKKHEDSSKVKSLIKSPKIMSCGDTRGIRNEADFESNHSINVHSSSSNKTQISARKANEVNEIVRSPIIKKSNSSTTNF
ncbi:hypothetical protein AVEN_114795-1 [Araneus ventricosus]|uniref:Uncharacterized protein n=1 Tax=Araneus ventricosus TaxID=182803 RepID=A0A4Y2KFF3_ARAVE|nr:hypothetical protein AVEN_114795-1 [Araneus ventricosus]